MEVSSLHTYVSVHVGYVKLILRNEAFLSAISRNYAKFVLCLEV